MAVPRLLAAAPLALAACSSAEPLRIATFNTSLNRPTAGALTAELEAGSSAAADVAFLLQELRPDIVLLNEVGRDPAGQALHLLCERYLARPQDHHLLGLDLPHRIFAEVNTGQPSGLDLDRDGELGGPGDAHGYGLHPGQYGMALLSRHPILHGEVRSFRSLRWSTMPGHRIPTGFYPPEIAAELRLSSKSHWDVPVLLPDGRILHVLASHPTPPVFDGPEDRNGRRNHDEIRFWADYLSQDRAAWIVDDQGRRGGLAPDRLFVIAGDLNCDPFDGDTSDAPIRLLLEHPRVAGEVVPQSEGAVEAAARQGGANLAHRGPAAADTGDSRDVPGPGNLRVDYLLPARGLEVLGSGVFWPRPGEAGHRAAQVSDHRPVWLDLR